MNRSRTLSSAFVIYTLPALAVFSAILLTFGFMVLIFSVLAGVHLGESQRHPNPFAGYAALWPGQPATNISAFARLATDERVSCLSSSPSQTGFAFSVAGLDMFCSFTVREGPFRMLSVLVRGGEITELRFFSDKLPEDDLTLYWGIPDQIQTSANRYQLEMDWERATYSATASIDMVDATVKSVMLTAKR